MGGAPSPNIVQGFPCSVTRSRAQQGSSDKSHSSQVGTYVKYIQSRVESLDPSSKLWYFPYVLFNFSLLTVYC